MIEGFYLERARALGIKDAHTGSTTAVHRFGSDLALNVHFHTLLLDGVYDSNNKFTPINPPSREQMHAPCTDIASQVAQYFEERATDDECEPDERALAIAFSRSAARRGATAHAPDDAKSEQDAQLDPDCSNDTWRCKARVAG